MDLKKYKKTTDGRFLYVPTTLKLPIHVVTALLDAREQMGTPLARQISEILQKSFPKRTKARKK